MRHTTVNTPPYGSPWQQVFVHAMLEMDCPRVPEKIAAAEHAIQKRLSELPVSQANAPELEALISAINKISRLKRSA